jgi:DNA-binding NtrC family response regulator
MSIAVHKPRVAVVDDERIIADTLAKILTIHGYEVKAHYSGESAVAGFGEFRPEIILSDVCMQGMNGIEAAIQIRKLHPECRIILFTASHSHHSIQARINVLGFEFLHRPLNPRKILALLRSDFDSRSIELSTTSISAESAEPAAIRSSPSMRVKPLAVES